MGSISKQQGEDVNTEQKIAELEKQLADLKAELAAPKEWKPEVGEKYWLPHNSGNVGCFEWDNDELDNAVYARGLVFRTKEEVQAWDDDRVEYYAVIRELRKIAAGFVPDWGNRGQEKRVLTFDHKGKKWGIDCLYHCQLSPWPVFETKEQAERALALGDRLNVLLRWPR